MFDGRVAAAFYHQSGKSKRGNAAALAALQWVARPPGSDTHRPAAEIDKGVRGFDLEDRGGGSEPTSPDRRERAGNTNTRQ